MTIAVLIIWQRKSWIDPYGSTVFIAVVILATIAGTLRLHMWFVSQFQSGNLLALRARVLRPLIFCESLLAALLLAVGVALSGPHDGTAAQLIIIALLIGMSLIVIEPATTRASLPPS
jgi:hypothetical protein